MRTPASTPKIRRRPDGTWLVERFSPIRRVEHLVTIAVFVVLVLTGFPQKFYLAGWATWIIDLLGGLDNTRWVHRAAGFAFVAQALVHLSTMVVGTATRRMRMSLLPTVQDLRDAWSNLLYYLGYRPHPPRLPKFDYRQKFEYVGIVLGGLVMVFSGLILMYPTLTASLLPGEVIPAARVAHSNEALLALLVLVVWHVYGSHLSPDVFPMDTSIFTGYMEVDDLQHHHPLEYDRLFPEGVPGAPEEGVPGAPEDELAQGAAVEGSDGASYGVERRPDTRIRAASDDEP